MKIGDNYYLDELKVWAQTEALKLKRLRFSASEIEATDDRENATRLRDALNALLEGK